MRLNAIWLFNASMHKLNFHLKLQEHLSITLSDFSRQAESNDTIFILKMRSYKFCRFKCFQLPESKKIFSLKISTFGK